MIRLKKGMAWLLSALCIFTMSQVPGITAQAAENQYIKFEQSEYEINTDTTQTIKIVPKQAGGKVSYGCPAPHADIHSDNPQVATAILDEDWQGADVNYVGVDVKTGELSGTAVLSINLDDGSTISCTIKVKDDDDDDTPLPTPSSNTKATSTPSEHTHNFSWVTVQEVTTAQDGIEEYRCDCGMVEERSIIPSSQVYVKGLYGAIKNAPENGEASFDSGKISTISDYIIKKLQERNDVKTVINFEYKNAKYKMTIPAGVDYTKLLEDQDYFYGYFFFAGEVGATIENL